MIPSNAVKIFRMTNVLEQFINLIKDKFFWIVFSLTMVLGFLVYAPYYLSENAVIDMLYNIAFYRPIFLVAVATAAWRYGTKAGVIACLSLSPVVFFSYLMDFMLRPLSSWKSASWFWVLLSAC
jgi:hypothetical protein